MLGLHPDQDEMEQIYDTLVKPIYVLLRFCHNKIRTSLPEALDSSSVQEMLQQTEQDCRSMGVNATIQDLRRFLSKVPELVAKLIDTCVSHDPRVNPEQLQHEFDRLKVWNSSLANALLQLFVDTHDWCIIKDVYFKQSHAIQYERITIYLYDSEMDEFLPPRFSFMPALHQLLTAGPEALVNDMMDSFWKHLLRHAYFATSQLKANPGSHLHRYFLSDLSHDLTIPSLLNAHFTPSYPLSFYLCGKAGPGNSSLIRSFSPALMDTIERYLDPEIPVRFVKQNLNKPSHVLQLELDLRPNNNDMSLMSIIQGRRMTRTQTKPGLVVVDLEEMPSDNKDADPNQL